MLIEKTPTRRRTSTPITSPSTSGMTETGRKHARNHPPETLEDGLPIEIEPLPRLMPVESAVTGGMNAKLGQGGFSKSASAKVTFMDKQHSPTSFMNMTSLIPTLPNTTPKSPSAPVKKARVVQFASETKQHEIRKQEDDQIFFGNGQAVFDAMMNMAFYGPASSRLQLFDQAQQCAVRALAILYASNSARMLKDKSNSSTDMKSRRVYLGQLAANDLKLLHQHCSQNLPCLAEAQSTSNSARRIICLCASARHPLHHHQAIGLDMKPISWPGKFTNTEPDRIRHTSHHHSSTTQSTSMLWTLDKITTLFERVLKQCLDLDDAEMTFVRLATFHYLVGGSEWAGVYHIPLNSRPQDATVPLSSAYMGLLIKSMNGLCVLCHQRRVPSEQQPLCDTCAMDVRNLSRVRTGILNDQNSPDMNGLKLMQILLVGTRTPSTSNYTTSPSSASGSPTAYMSSDETDD